MNPAFLINLALNAFKAGWSIGAAIVGGTTSVDFSKYINVLMAVFNDFVNTEAWSQYRTADEWNNRLHPLADQMRQDTLGAFGAIGFTLNHIVDVIIPDSVNTGRRYSHGQLGPLLKRLQAVQGTANNAFSEASQTHKYIASYIAPEVGDWVKWFKIWKQYYYLPMLTLKDWIAAPALLSSKLTPSITPDIVGQLGQKNSRQTVDRLLKILLARAPDVVSAIDSAAVAVLESGSY